MISRKSYRRLKLRLHDIFLGFKIAAAIFAVALALINAIYATIYKRIRMLNPNAHDDGICYALYSKSKGQWVYKVEPTVEFTGVVREAELFMNTQWADYNKTKLNDEHKLDLSLYEVL
jgi:hypothetical protein